MNYSAFCWASEVNKRIPRSGTLDLPFFFRYKHITALKNDLSLLKARVCPVVLGQLLQPVCFDLLVERVSFVAIANRFEVRCQLKQLLLLYQKVCPCWPKQ